MSHSPLDKIQALDAIEKEIITCIQSAGQSLQELGKEKTSQKAVETNTQQFLKSLNIIETKLSEQINYLTQVSTGQPHEGSGYASAKVLQMAWHRIQHARSRVRELDDSKNKYMHNAARHQRQNAAAIAASTKAPSPTKTTAPSAIAPGKSMPSNVSPSGKLPQSPASTSGKLATAANVGSPGKPTPSIAISSGKPAVSSPASGKPTSSTASPSATTEPTSTPPSATPPTTSS